jgi:glutamate formiminotransferase/formiminotetrahydrofolate cyclodeaminase
VQRGLRGAIETPLAMMRGCAEAATAGVGVAGHGNASAASDVQVAFELLTAAARGAHRNVTINLSSLTDRDHAERVGREAAALEQEVEASARTAYGLLPS